MNAVVTKDNCPRCGSWKTSFVRFMRFGGQLSQEVEVSVNRCDECGKKFVLHRKLT